MPTEGKSKFFLNKAAKNCPTNKGWKIIKKQLLPMKAKNVPMKVKIKCLTKTAWAYPTKCKITKSVICVYEGELVPMKSERFCGVVKTCDLGSFMEMCKA